ncbi:MAG: hypothetical protein WCX31_05670 [Salinivirgaceae bacterium]
MKSTLLLFIVLFIASGLQAQIAGNLFSSKSGKIAYRYEYSGSVTNYSIYFDDFGKKQCFDLVGSNAGTSDHSRTIITPETMYVINYDDKQVMKFPLDAKEKSIDAYGGSSAGGVDLQEMMSAITKSGKGKVGQETVLGKNCDVYVFNESEEGKGKYWIWKDFVVKADFLDENGDHSYIEAKEIAIDAAVDSKVFEIPSGFEIMDMSQTMQQMKQLQEMYGIPEDDGQ